MLHTLFRAILANLTRHRLFTALNLSGLALGLAVFLTMALIVRYEYTYDSDLPHADAIYQLDEYTHLAGHRIEEDDHVSFVPFPFLKQDFPEINAGIRVLQQPLVVRGGSLLARENVTLTDRDFFTVFALGFLAGDPATALSGPGKVVISEQIARKYFGTTQALGKRLRIDNGDEEAIVTGVLAPQAPNRSLHVDLVIMTPTSWLNKPAFTNWGSEWGTIWLRINDAHAVSRINDGLKLYMMRHPGFWSPTMLRESFGTGGLRLVPLRAVHFHNAAIGEGGNSRALVDILGGVGLAALVTALVNYVNLATARAALRAREIAMRKVLGATRATLAVMILTEAVVMVTLAAIMALALTEITLRWINEWGGWVLAFEWGFVLPFTGGIVLAAGCLAGAYPALVLSAYRPAAILAASRMPAGGRVEAGLRSALVVLQFGFATTLAICTLIMTAQAEHVHNLDRGLKQQGLITLPSLGDESLRLRQRAIMEQLASVPNVVIATRSDMGPHNLVNRDDWRRVGHDDKHALHWGSATTGYFKALGATLLAGRYFDGQHGQDYVEHPRSAGNGTSVILSRLAASQLGFASPEAAIGQDIMEATEDGSAQTYRIIGVIDDIRFRGPRTPMTPLLYFGTSGPLPYGEGLIRYAGVSERVMLARLGAAWAVAAPDVAFDAVSVEDVFAEDYRTDSDHGTLFLIGSGIAIFIACLGLYGLSTFSAMRRMQEIGIRKVMGARTSDILRLMLLQFLRPVLAATLLAWPLAWALMRVWLSGFDERITMPLSAYGVSSVVALLIATTTIGFQAVQASRYTPAQALDRAG